MQGKGLIVAAKIQRLGRWAVTRGGVFAVELLYLCALWVLAVLYLTETIHPRHAVGNMPVPVVWFGALGAVLISLVGIFEHVSDWDRHYALWHWGRPFVGASFAVISVMIIQAGIVSVGSDPHQDNKSSALYFIVGFLVGYREETFRELIKRLVDVVLGPGTGPPALPTITAVSNQAVDVTIDGTGFVNVLSVKFGDQDATAVTTESPTRIRATAPASTQPGMLTAAVTTSAGTASADFDYQ